MSSHFEDHKKEALPRRKGEIRNEIQDGSAVRNKESTRCKSKGDLLDVDRLLSP
jgi:hypothetical protein